MMRQSDEHMIFERTVRAAWADLLGEALPLAARRRGWPVATAADFERILLDHVFGAPWEAATGGSGGDGPGLLELVLAIELAETLLDGAACPRELTRRSLALRNPRAGRIAARRLRDPCRTGCASDDATDCAMDDTAGLMRRALAGQTPTRRRGGVD